MSERKALTGPSTVSCSSLGLYFPTDYSRAVAPPAGPERHNSWGLEQEDFGSLRTRILVGLALWIEEHFLAGLNG